MTREQLSAALANHRAYLLEHPDGIRADLRHADLRGADLRGVDLECANLRDADLRDADLRDADLRHADLGGVDLRSANLGNANLEGANLWGANLWGADLWGANLRDADLAAHSVCPEVGAFIAFKKTAEGVVTLRIPEEAGRTSSLVGRKCRAAFAEVIAMPEGVEAAHSLYDSGFVYRLGETVMPANGYNDDIRVECAPGIHFFVTRGEAENY